MPELILDVDLALGAMNLHATLSSSARAIAVKGPSGAGKTTLLRILAGLEERARGRVSLGSELWQDSDMGLFTEPWLRRVGWVPQEASLFPHLTVRQNLSFAKAVEAEVEDMAEQLDLTPLLERAPRHLSGGERQRTALGRALLSRPRLLLLDEPFSALDEALRERAMDAVARFQERSGAMMVLASHYGEDCSRFEAQLWRLENGCLTYPARGELLRTH